MSDDVKESGDAAPVEQAAEVAMEDVIFIDRATADAIMRDQENRTARHRITPVLVEEGPQAGNYMLPAAIVNQTRYIARMRRLVGDTHAVVNVDVNTLFAPADASALGKARRRQDAGEPGGSAGVE